MLSLALLGAHASAGVRCRAEGPATSLTGSWQAGATSMQVSVQSWGSDCGPQPQSSQSAGGGSVNLEQQGDALVIHGRERDVRSDRCWSPNPTLRRVASSFANGLWTTRCQTPAQDPREEQGNYTLKLIAADRLLYQDVSRFNWRLNRSTCAATITTTQTLHRMLAGSKPTPTPATPATPATSTAKPAARGPKPVPALEDVHAPCVPKAAARLSLRPHHAEIALGERVCFHARPVDAAGCPSLDAPVTWSLRQAGGIHAKLEDGCLQAGESSAESEGEFRVVAALGKLRAEATVQVTAESLTALLAKRLQAGAIDGPGEAVPPPGSPEVVEHALTEPAANASVAVRVAARAVSEPDAPSAERWLAAIGAVLAASAAGLLLYRRSSARRRASRTTKSRKRRCPDCGASFPESSAFCGKDGAALLPPQ